MARDCNHCRISAVSAVITVTAHVAGSAGNALATVTSSAPAVSVQQALLAGGIDAATVNVNGTTLVESTDFNAVTSNNQTATNLAAAIDALALVNAPAPAAAVITVSADAVSSAGNAYVFSKTGSGLTLSGTGHLAGGVDGLNVTISGTAGTAQKTVNAAAMTGAVSGNMISYHATNASVTVTTSWQYLPFGFKSKHVAVHVNDTTASHNLYLSLDGINTFDILVGSTVSASGYSLGLDEELIYDVETTGIWVKYDTTLGSPWEISAW